MSESASLSRRRAAATVLAASTLTIMAAAVISPSLPAMRAVYAGTPEAELLVKLVVTITSAAIAISAPAAGAFSARYGTRAVLVSGLVLYAVSGTAGLLTFDLIPLLISRVALGIAVGAIMTSASTTIATLWGGDERARLLGAQQLFASIGGVVFISLSGWLSTITWRAPFGIYAVALLMIPLAASARLAPGARAVHAINASLRIARNDLLRVVGIYFLAFAATAVFFLAPTQLPFALDALGTSTTVTGLVVAACTATGAIGSLLFPRVRRRLQPAAVAAVGLAMLGAGWLLVGNSTSSSVYGVLIGALIGGIGVGVIVPDLNLWVSDLTSAAHRGPFLGGLVSATFAGQFASPIMAQPFTDAAGTGPAFVGGAVIVLVVALVLASARTPRNSRASSGAESPQQEGQTA